MLEQVLEQYATVWTHHIVVDVVPTFQLMNHTAVDTLTSISSCPGLQFFEGTLQGSKESCAYSESQFPSCLGNGCDLCCLLIPSPAGTPSSPQSRTLLWYPGSGSGGACCLCRTAHSC